MTREIGTTLLRGLKKRCPQCGKGLLFEKWGDLREKCTECGCPLRAREPDIWFFMYVSVAIITGSFIILLFFILPMDQTVFRVGAAMMSIVVYLGTYTLRKSVAIAIDYLVDSRLNHPKFPTQS